MSAAKSSRASARTRARHRASRWPALRFGIAGLMAAMTLAAVTATAPVPGVTPTAQAVPGVPAAPTTLFTENFENRAANSNVLLSQYTGASGMTYTGDPLWVNRANCNGLIINRTSPIVAGDCGSAGTYDGLTALPHALGLLNGAANPSANAAAAAYTSSTGADGLIQFRTATPLSLPSANGRFVTFSVDAAAVNCWAPDQPRLRFYLVDGNGVEQPVSSTPINPCTDPAGQDFAAQSANGTAYTVRAGRFAANGSMLMSGNSLGIVMRNEEGGGFGNDGAYDDIRVLDVTPTLDKSFSPTTVNTGGTSTLTFTITNTDELGSKNGWSFTDALPSGLTIASGNTSTTCPSGTITAPAGGTSVAVSGNLNAGMTSCTATVNVTSDTAGTYTNGPGNVTETGLNPPGSSSVEFVFSGPTVDCDSDPNLFNTGYNSATGAKLADGTTDPRWQVSGPYANRAISTPPAGATWAAPYVGNKVPNNGFFSWAQSPYGNAEWISLEAPGVLQTTMLANYYYRYQFYLDPAVDAAPFSLDMSFNADNSVAEIFVNGIAQSPALADVPQSASAPYTHDGFRSATGASARLDSNWQTGLNSMIVQVRSDPAAEGLLAQMEPQVLCPSLTVAKEVDGRLDAADQFTVAVEESDGTVLTSVTTSGTDTSVVSDPAYVAQGTAYTITDALAVGSALGNYDKTATCTGALSGSTVTLPGSGPEWAFTPAAIDDYTCTVTNTARAATLELLKEAGSPVDVNGNGITDSGDTIAYTFTVTNTGEVTMDDIAVDDAMVGSVTCPQTTLDAGDSTTCTADNPYTVMAADVTAGSVDNTATASGTPPGSTTPVTSDPSTTTTVTTEPDPGLSIAKSANPANAAAYTVGQVIDYSFLVTNTGNVPMEEVTVDETTFSGTGSMSAVSCPATTVAVGGQMTCTASYTLTQPDIDSGSLTNAATATGTPPGSNTPVDSPPDSVTIPQDPAPALTMAKSSDPSTVAAAGEVITYSFLVTNTGNVTINGVAVAEQSFSGTGAMSAITCPDTRLIPGESTTCTATYTVTQVDINGGQLTNTATATGTPPSGPAVESPEGTATVTTPDDPSLTVEKSAVPAIAGEVGDEITYSFVVTNDGNVTISDVAIDEGVFSGTGTMSAITCPNDNDLDPDESMTCTATYQVTQDDIDADGVANTATATGTPPSGPAVESPEGTATVATPDAPELEVVKSANPTSAGAVGQTITYSFLVTNTGNVTMSGIVIVEGAFSGTGTMSAITCPQSAESLAPGAEVSCTATYTLTQADVNSGSVTNTATATGTPPSGPPVDSPPSTSTVTVTPAPALTVDKSAVPGTVGKPGDVVTYTFLVTNTGNVTISDIAVDEGAFSGTGQLSAIACPATSLASSAQMTCTATYSVTQADVDRGDLTNTATVTGTPPTGPEVESPPDTTTVTTPDVPGLSIVKSASPTDVDSFTAGAVITYSFVVTNTGNVTMTGVGVGEQSFTGSGSLSAITCPPAAASVAPGGQVTCTATYTVTQADVDAGGITNVAAGTGTPPSGPPVKSPPDEVRIPEPAAPSLTVVKSSDTDRLTDVGQEITYSFLVTNTGNVTVSDVVVDEGEFNGSGELSPVHCPAVRSLAPGKQLTCTATYTVVQADLDKDSITNTATATGTPPSGPSVESSPDTVEVPSTGRGRLELTKQADAVDVDGNGTIEAGDRIEWTIEVSNPGTATVRDITVSDPTAGKVTCPRSTLRPGQSMTCTVRAHTVTAADVAAGRVRNTAVVSGVETEGVSAVISDAGSAIATLGDEGSSPLPDTGASRGMRAAGLVGGLALLAGALLLIGARRRRSVES